MITLAELTLYDFSDNIAQANILLDEINEMLIDSNVKFWSSDNDDDKEIRNFEAYPNGRNTFWIPQHKLEDGIYSIKSYEDSNFLKTLERGKDYYLDETNKGAVRYIQIKKSIYEPCYLEINGKWGVSADNNKPQSLLNTIAEYLKSRLNIVENEGLEFNNLSMGDVRINTKTKEAKVLDQEFKYKLHAYS